jgi:hypothetical protein
VENVIETAATARSKCRGCQAKIDKGTLRFGEAVPNAFGSGEALHWYHLRCGAERRSESFLPTLEAHAPADDVPERDELLELARIGAAHPRWCRFARAERASSGRARCQQCRELIAKDALRIVLERIEDGMMNAAGFVHVRCAGAYAETTIGVYERLRRATPDLSDADWDEVAAELAASE